MRLRVLLFASLRDAVGQPSVTVELDGRPTVKRLLERLETEHPSLRGRLDHIRVAVDQEFQSPEAEISGNCEVALIPPVSGG